MADLSLTAMLVAVALLPALGIERVSVGNLRRVRDGWLWGLLAVGTLVVGGREPWLGVIGLYLCWWWLQPPARDLQARTPAQKLPTVLTWVGIAATWHVGLALPAWAWPWLATAWGVWAWLGTGGLLWEVRHREWAKVRGGWGMRSISGAFFALVLPVLPLGAWPGPLVGLWLTGPSWLAVGALAIASLVRWPQGFKIAGMLLAMGILAAVGRLCWVWVRRPWPAEPAASLLEANKGLLAPRWGWQGWQPVIAGRKVLEWTPRGDSLDSLRHRGLLLRLAWAEWRSARTWLMGIGPGVTNLRHMQLGCRRDHPIQVEMTGTLHCEPAQLAYEYGVAGVLVVLLFTWRVGSHLTWGDPWSAAVVAGAVLASGTMALRVAPLGLLWLLMCAKEVSG